MIEPYLPLAKGIGRPRGWPLREIINGIFYGLRFGCPWRRCRRHSTPGDRLSLFAAWRDACLSRQINHALALTDRERRARSRPSAADIDSQRSRPRRLAPARL